MAYMRHSDSRFFRAAGRSPILRISLATLLLGPAACSKLGLGDKSPTAPSGPPAVGSTIRYTAIGASDVTGFGSSLPCLTPFADCPDSTGYVFVAARQLRAQGFTVTVSNLGILTAVISRGFQTLGQQYGRFIAGNFIEQEMPFVPRDATLVTIFAGGNEVNTITAALGGGAGSGDQVGYIEQQVRNFGTDYTTLITGIRDRAGSPRIVALNVPNLGGMPLLANASLPQKQAAQRASVGMTRAVNILISQGILVIDLMCDPRSYQSSTYSGDGFHPSDAGYAFMAAEVVRAVTSASYPAPAATCAQMTLVP